MGTLNCKEVEERLWRYVDRELPAAERALLTAHFADCPGCRALFEDAVRELRLCREALWGVNFGEELVRKCMARLQAEGLLEKRARPGVVPIADVRRVVWTRGLRLAGALIAACALVGTIAVLWSRPVAVGSFEAKGLAVVPGRCDAKGNVLFESSSAFRGVLYAGSAFRVPVDSTLLLTSGATGPASAARCEVQGPAVFCVDAGARRGHFSGTLYEGELLAEVEGFQRTETFVVVTPHARVRVTGTKFRVLAALDETWVTVLEGKVAIESLNPEGSSIPWSEAVVAEEGRWVVRRGEPAAPALAGASALPSGPDLEATALGAARGEKVEASGSGQAESPTSAPEEVPSLDLPPAGERPALPPSDLRGLDLPVDAGAKQGRE